MGEETFAGTPGNDENAPIPAIRGTEIERRGSILSGHLARRMKSRFL
jgi:hypothetical protein